MAVELFVSQDESVLEVDGSDGCATNWMYLIH